MNGRAHASIAFCAFVAIALADVEFEAPRSLSERINAQAKPALAIVAKSLKQRLVRVLEELDDLTTGGQD